jgi:hypothetical protein
VTAVAALGSGPTVPSGLRYVENCVAEINASC